MGISELSYLEIFLYLIFSYLLMCSSRYSSLMDKEEMRCVMKYLHMKSKTPLQIFHEMKDTYEENGPSIFVLGKKIQIWLL